MLCQNRMVDFEAACAVYKLNTFEFAQRPTWQVLHDFLLEIGESNRRKLRSLIVYADSSEISPQYKEPGRLVLPKYLTLPSTFLDGLVSVTAGKVEFRQDTAAIVETCFQILGQAGSKLTLTIDVSDISLLLGYPFSKNRSGCSDPDRRCLGLKEYAEDIHLVCRNHTAEQIGRMDEVQLLWRSTVSDRWLVGAEVEFLGWKKLSVARGSSHGRRGFLVTRYL